MHVLDDPGELSPRAQELLRRTGRRERPEPELAPEQVQFWDPDKNLMPPPELLVGSVRPGHHRVACP